MVSLWPLFHRWVNGGAERNPGQNLGAVHPLRGCRAARVRERGLQRAEQESQVRRPRSPGAKRYRAPTPPRSSAVCTPPPRGRALGAGPPCCCFSGAPPLRGARTTRLEGPPPLPLPLPAQLARLFVSNIRVSPLARLRGRGSGAILDSVQIPSPTPPPVHGPSGLGPCARGPGPAPPRYAQVGRAPARAPPPPPGPCVAPEPGPQPAPPAAALSPAPPPGPWSLHAARGRRRRKRVGKRPKEGAGRTAQPPPGPARPWSAARPCPRAPGVRGAAPRNMTAPWAALALLWGSLCAGKDGARRGGRGEGARGRPRAPRGVYQQRAAPRPPRRATCTKLTPPGAGTGRPARASWEDDPVCAATCGARVCGGDPMMGAGPGAPGSGFRLRERVEPREREENPSGQSGQAGRADLIQGWRDCRFSSGWGQNCATLRATRCCEAKGAASPSPAESFAPHPTDVCVVFPKRRAVGTSFQLRPLSLRRAPGHEVQPPRRTALFWAPGKGGGARRKANMFLASGKHVAGVADPAGLGFGSRVCG